MKLDRFSLAYATGLNEEDLFNLLLLGNLIKCYGEENYRCNVQEWERFLYGNDELELNLSRYKKTHYLCMSLPLYSHPGKQMKMIPEDDISKVVNCVLPPNFMDEFVEIREEAICKEDECREFNYNKRKRRDSDSIQDNQLSSAIEEEFIVVEIVNPQLEKIRTYLALNFTPNINHNIRLSRDGCHEIKLHKKNQLDELHRILIVYEAGQLGYHNIDLTYQKRQQAAHAACCVICYDYGFKKPIGRSMIQRWIRTLEADLEEAGRQNPLSSNHSGSTSYMNKIERNDKGYLRELYRKATKTVGTDATFLEITANMNANSAIANETRPTLKLHQLQVYRWFVDNKGLEKSSLAKPFLTPKYLVTRLEYANEELKLLDDDKYYSCHLDEKWFYTNNRRRKNKHLPNAGTEEPSGLLRHWTLTDPSRSILPR